MQPNNTLDFRRLGLYFRQHLTASVRSYLLGIASMFVLLAIIPVLIILSNNSVNELSDIVPFYYIGLFFCGLLFTSMVFNDFSNKEKAVHFLMLPASQFEKFITLHLISSIGFLLVYHLCAYSALQVIQQVSLLKTGATLKMNWDFFSDNKGQIYAYYAYIFLHAVFLLGATSFNKLAFIKTLISLVVILAGIYLLNSIFLKLMFGNKMAHFAQQMPFTIVNTRKGTDNNYIILIPPALQHTYIFIAKYILAPILWTVAYFRLKDKEI